jgi:hypothetical protein
MKKTLFTYLILIMGLNLTAQELRDLEKSISQTIISDTMEIRIKAEQIFKIDPYNEIATFYLIESYRCTKNDSLIQKFFQSKKSYEPDNPLPYLLSAKFQYQAFSIKDTLSLTELKKAFKLDAKNYEVNYLLGISYYQLFNESIVLDSTTNVKFYASQSWFYLTETIRIDSSSLSSLKYLIIQLSNFLGKGETSVFYQQIEINPVVTKNNLPDKGQYYFPVSNFIELPNGWDTNYKADILRAVNLSSFLLRWFTYQLNAFNEPIIFNQLTDTIYRFTWLRSFHHPVVIRIQKTKGKILLNWKMADGAGGYDPGNIIVDKEKVLSENKWLKLQQLLTGANFWSLPTNEVTNRIGDDGSRWIVEGIENGKYNVVNRWSPRVSDFQEIGKYLIKLTELKIPKKDFY